MTTISRLNTTISGHIDAANYIALSLLIAGVIVGAIALDQNGSLANLYETSFQPVPTTPTPVNETTTPKTQVVPQTSSTVITVGNSTPLSLQNQPLDAAGMLQSAQNMSYQTTIADNFLQPATNGIQQTGINPQAATASIQ